MEIYGHNCQNYSVSKSNQLHVVIFRYSYYWWKVYPICSIGMMDNFLEVLNFWNSTSSYATSNRFSRSLIISINTGLGHVFKTTHSLRVASTLWDLGPTQMGFHVPLMLASPNLEAKPHLRDKVLTFEPQEAIKIWLIFIKVGFWLFYA